MQLDSVAELFQLAQAAPPDRFVVQLHEIVRSQVLLGRLLFQDVADRDQNRVPHRRHGPFLAAPSRQAVILRRQIGLALPHRCPSRLIQSRPQVPVPLADRRLPLLARALAIARTHLRPRGQLLGAGKGLHLYSDLGDDRLGVLLLHPGNRLEQLRLLLKRFHLFGDLLLHPPQRPTRSAAARANAILGRRAGEASRGMAPELRRAR